MDSKSVISARSPLRHVIFRVLPSGVTDVGFEPLTDSHATVELCENQAMEGICPLCQKHGKIIRSHIIPEFFRRAVSDEDGRAVVIHGALRPARMVQQAFMHPLLCAECDGFVNTEYEMPFLAFWRQAAPGLAWGRNYLLTVPDYARFKLFLLSVLWRAGVCRVGAFAKVDLQECEPVLRDMLLNRDALSMHDFPIFGALLLVPESLQVAHTLVSPVSTEFEGSRGYMIGFGGCLWHFMLRREPLPVWAHEWILMEDGRIGLPTIHLNQLGNIDRTFKDYIELATSKGWRNPWEK
jgi:hypothetical protein